MTDRLQFGFSPCPNDTFMFHALVAGLVPGVQVQPWLADIEVLNTRAMQADDALPVTKLSVHALAHVCDRYTALATGAALGRGCGPLVVVRTPVPDHGLAALTGKRVAIPGRWTTAHLLLRTLGPEVMQVVPMHFAEIMPAVAAGSVDAGLVIHESRFTYADHGLAELADLGVLWEAQTGLPLPLGVIAAKRSLGAERLAQLEQAIADSLALAWQHPQASAEYIRQHAQEIDPEVCRQHIALYVNEFSRDLGSEGRAAIDAFIARGRAAGFVPPGPSPWR